MTTIIETHPYNLRETIPEKTRLLIVGTAPPPRFSNPACGGMIGRDFDFFYGSYENRMWQILNGISEEKDHKTIFAEDDTPEMRRDAARDFLRSNNIWMRDVLQKYQRKPERECSPKDDHIKQPDVTDCTDFQTIFDECQHLSVVAFTSEKAAEWTFKKLGGPALDCYFKALQRWKDISNGRALNDYFSEKYQKAFYQHPAGRRNIDFYILPTPAKRSATRGMNLKKKEEIYKYVLFTKGSTK